MSLEFVTSVEEGTKHLNSGDWLDLASVHGLTDADFVTLPNPQRQELFRCAEAFRAIAKEKQKGANVSASEESAARAALTRIRELLRPYRTRESKAVGDVLWGTWKSQAAQDWMPTFDFQLGDDSTGDPAVWVWLILKDGVDPFTRETLEKQKRLELLIHARLQDAGIDRWPYFWVRRWEDARFSATVPA